MNEFVILYVISMVVLIFDSIHLGIIQAKLDTILNKLDEEEN